MSLGFLEKGTHMSVVSRRQFVTGAGLVAAAAALAACGAQEEQTNDGPTEQEAAQQEPVEEQATTEAAALSLDSREISCACRDLGAKVLVARRQGRFMDRFRDPLVAFG